MEDKAAEEGLRIRGKMECSREPDIRIVDFSSYIARKDEIFTEF